MVAALRAEAERLAVEVRTGTEVTAIEPAPAAPSTSAPATGSCGAGFVVNAAGPAAGQVAALAGSDLPVAPVRRNLAYVREPDGGGELIPMCVDLDTGCWSAGRPAAGSWSPGPTRPTSRPGTTVDPRFLEQLAQRVGNFPLEELPLDPRQCWAGLYPETRTTTRSSAPPGRRRRCCTAPASAATG